MSAVGNEMRRKISPIIIKKMFPSVAFVLFFALFAAISHAQTTEFTYQGRLADGGQTANGNFDLEFRLFDAETGGTEIGALQRLNVPVAGGIFSVKLDFGANFDGQTRFLEIAVKPPGSANSFVTLAPRQTITSAPYAIKSLTATNALQLGGIAANQYVLTGDSRLNDDRNPLPNSANYIQNATATQANADFAISGSGTLGGTLSAETVNARTDFSLSGNRVLSIAGTDNLFAGIAAGSANTSGSGNAFFGSNGGSSNTGGVSNAFFGSSAGLDNTLGSANSFFGFRAGENNTTANFNSFFGILAGFGNTRGESNSFFGKFSGIDNTDGTRNSFFGAESGISNRTGNFNSFFGNTAGETNSTGNFNTFFGASAGRLNTTGSNNTIIGASANVAANNFNVATAIGSFARVTTSNTIQLGRTGGEDRVIAPGGIALRDGSLRLREPNDTNHSIGYDSAVDGIRFAAFGGFRWFNSRLSRIQMDLTTAGDLFIVGSYRQISDARYKTDVQTLTGALDTIGRLRGVTFNWKSEQNDNRRTQIGFIAQEIEEVLPSLVSTDENGYKSISYPNVVPVLVEAFKEQQSQIEAQKAQIKEQKQQLQDQQLLFENLRRIVCRSNAEEKICQQ